VGTEPEGQVLAGVAAIDIEITGVRELAGVAVGGAVDHHQRGAGRDVDAADGGGKAREPEVALYRALEPQRLLDERRDPCPSAPEEVLEIGMLTDELERAGKQPHRCFLSRSEEVGRDANDVDHLGRRAVGERRGREPGHDVVPWRSPAILDVGGEPVVEEFQRTVRHRVALGAAHRAIGPHAQLLPERLVVFLGNPEQIRDDEHRERRRVSIDELACAVGGELVDDLIGEPPHKFLVLPQALRRDQSHQQRAVCRVHRRIERRELVAERQLVAVLLDELADVAPLEQDGEPGEGSRHRVARRERLGVVVHHRRFLVPRHHVHAVVRLADHRALLAELVEVRIRIRNDPVIAEEVDVLETAHSATPCRAGVITAFTA
jgi:hypothetical protein